MARATGQERELFKKSDLEEWNSNLQNEVVRELSFEEQQRVQRDHPERIMGSRFVRVKKELTERLEEAIKARDDNGTYNLEGKVSLGHPGFHGPRLRHTLWIITSI